MPPAKRRWVGPPRLLLAATVLGIVLVPAMSAAQDGPAPAVTTVSADVQESGGAGPVAPTPTQPTAPLTQPSGSGPTVAARPQAPTAPAAPAPKTIKPPKPQTIGVATFNEFRRLDVAEARADADKLTSRRDVDIVGWQEGYNDEPVYRSLGKRGWDTKHFAHGARELGVSWRRSMFSLVGASQTRMAQGIDAAHARYPFGDTWVLRVTLRDKASGRLLTVLDTHFPHKIENLDDPGHWSDTYNARSAKRQLQRMRGMWGDQPGRWVIGTGDYNFDDVADARVRPLGGLDRVFHGHAVSSYDALGRRGLQPTHPYSGRFLDYVHVAADDLADKRVRFDDQHTPLGFNSDHLPLVVRLTLR